jgi:serine protease Do
MFKFKVNRVSDRQPARILSALILAAALAVFFAQGRAMAEVKMIPATFADVVDKASPAVVNISTEKTVKSSGGPFRGGPGGPGGPGDPFQEFFDKFFGGRPPMGDRKETSLGTGFIIEPSGLIITNNHVVEDADDIKVKMSDKKEYKATVLGRDPKTDVALIKIEGNGSFPFLKLGDSSAVRIGDWVVAIGNPFGLDQTVTSGILSARGRAIGAGPYDDFLQTDASINPGNSGGPLLNLDGEVIGINTAMVRGGDNIGFAIPANMAKSIVAQLRDKGKVVRGWLGVMIQKVTPELAKSFNLKSESGALVADVTPGSPADEAGLKRGDVIVKFNDRDITEMSELPTVVADTPVGSTAKATVIRDGQTKTFSIKIAELKDEESSPVAPAESNDLGLNVQDLTPEMAQRLGLTETAGVVITGMSDDSPAADSGMKPGDLIVEINRDPIKTIADYNRVVGDFEKGETVLFLIKRGPNTLFFTVDLK